ncbi:MAG: fructose PTS transporter subunit IIB [Aurantimicrobium sp.]|nr:fructose PTS transporter subunit IIB [Aurantimicrobium sp.]
MRIVAVTSCLTGIAHTYMAAEALEQAAKKLGHDITVETQGSAGSTAMPQAIIDSADFCLFANDLDVKDIARFSGKPFVHVSVSTVLNDATSVLAACVADFSAGTLPSVDPVTAGAATSATASGDGAKKRGFFSRLFS